MISKNSLKIQLGEGIALTSSSDLCKLGHTFYIRQGNILTFEFGELGDEPIFKYCRRLNKEYDCNRAIYVYINETTNDEVTEVQLWFAEAQKDEFIRIKEELLSY